MSIVVEASLLISDTHHLVPTRFRNSTPEALGGLWDSTEEAEILVALAGITDDHRIATHGLLPGIGIHELVFGIPFADVINAAFTHASPFGSRFNKKDRGAWYAALEKVDTAIAEVGFHKQQELLETDWNEPEECDYDDYLADFSGYYSQVSREDRSSKLLLRGEPVPDCYRAPQAFADFLLMEGAAGLVYPSVRDRSGSCIVCFRPALVQNVRRSSPLRITVDSTGITSWASIAS